MCGIAGAVSNNMINEADMVAAITCLSYRGPDGAGTKILNNGHVALGHRRLSIIDLSDAGAQPMCNEDGSLWLTFNGEIYNYEDLRRQLIAKGHQFRSHADSEVLIHGYEEWGERLVDRLHGMFAFALWDDRKKRLFLARDRFGIKPLYYYFHNGIFLFASELKSFFFFPEFKRQLNVGAVIDYLHFYLIPYPKTIWRNTFKLQPGCCLTYQAGDEAKVSKYWEIQPGGEVMSDVEAIRKTEALLTEAVSTHLVSDVPVGVFLSSGLDSSALLALMKKFKQEVNTFSIGFKDSHKTEHAEAAVIASHFKTNHHELILEEDFLDIVSDLSSYYDEPYAISSLVSYYYVSKLASAYNKVVFAGDGGDEVFGGYKWYAKIIKTYNSRSIMEKIVQLNKRRLKNFYQQNYFRYMGTNVQWVKNILSRKALDHYPEHVYWPYEMPDDYWSLSPIKVFQLLDFKRFVPDAALTRADRSSMACSLEVRVPLLDHRLAEFTMGLDDGVYYREDVKKHLLFENIKHLLPDQILRLPKRGFGNPLSTFYAKKDRIIVQIKTGPMMHSGLFSPTLVLEKLDQKQLWLIYNLHLWWNNWNKA